jgi:hypothetical protein
MIRLMRFPSARRRDPAVDAWLRQDRGDLGFIARHWFACLRHCGSDVRELLHDGHPTACVGDAAFAYVNAFTLHVNVGFFLGTELHDPAGLLVGTGKFMRHVKLLPGKEADERGLENLIEDAYAGMKAIAESGDFG